VRYTALFIACLALLVLVSDTGLSQANIATQALSFTVNAVQKISLSGTPNPLVISDGTTGTDALATASDNNTRYSIVHNGSATKRITAVLDSDLPAGMALSVALATGSGSSAGSVVVSAGTAVNLVTGITRGAFANQPIVYTFSANASAGELPTTTKTVTLTLTD
jgi:hypothetical protein